MLLKAAKLPRGPARKDAQLSVMQRQFLVWLYDEEIRTIQALWALPIPKGKRDSQLRELRRRGVPWAAKRFYKDALKTPMSADARGVISRMVARLEQRGLVSCYDATRGLGGKRRTSHVKLTPLGSRVARSHSHNAEN